VRSRYGEDTVDSNVVADRLAHVFGQHQPRRAAGSGGPAEVRGEPEAHAQRADDQSLTAIDLEEARSPARPRFSRLHVGVVCSLVLLGVVFAALAVLRARPVALATPQSVPVSVSTSPPNASPPAASTNSSPRPRIVVHVLGAVRRPGLVRLPQGSRVQDAIDAAGGLLSSAAPGELNLAQILTDGQQMVVGSRAHPGGRLSDGGSGPGSSSAGSRSSPQVDLNNATATQLDSLPGVGPVTAERILAWRSEHGSFRRVEELQEVEGIGPKTYADIAPHVRV
jgi:competence protein ComEA